MAGSDDESETPLFKPATIHEILKLVIAPTTRVSGPALHLSAEYLRLFATEALHRAAEVAAKERLEKDGTVGGGGTGPSLLEVRHLEKIAVGLILDF